MAKKENGELTTAIVAKITPEGGKQKTFLENRSMVSSKCTSCWARFLCGGGCLHDNYIYSGYMAQPDPRFCKEIKRRIEMAIYVYDVLKKNKQIS